MCHCCCFVVELRIWKQLLKAWRRGVLSLLSSQSGTRWRNSRIKHLSSRLSSFFNFDGRLTANDGGGCVTFATDGWGAALGAKQLSIRDDFITRVWCLASGAKTRVAGTFIYDFKHRLNVTKLLLWRIIDRNKARVYTKRTCDFNRPTGSGPELVIRRPWRSGISPFLMSTLDLTRDYITLT